MASEFRRSESVRPHPRLWMLLPALLTIGCPTRPKFDRPPTIEIASPEANARVTGTITVSVSLGDDDLDLPVSLFADTSKLPFATATRPENYRASFDTGPF